MIAAVTDFVKGGVFKEANNFKDFEVIFENKQAKKIFDHEMVHNTFKRIETKTEINNSEEMLYEFGR